MNDGGPAFPRSPHSGDCSGDGMTLRDWFAGQALAGIMATQWRPSGDDVSPLAEDAYKVADAMLAMREAK